MIGLLFPIVLLTKDIESVGIRPVIREADRERSGRSLFRCNIFEPPIIGKLSFTIFDDCGNVLVGSVNCCVFTVFAAVFDVDRIVVLRNCFCTKSTASVF